ncbi:Histone-lysine N-methyltransferase SETMAR, partial [Stegodyphus mimosarum]
MATLEISERINLSNSTVHDHWKRLGLISRLDIWVPHVLTERNFCHCIDICDLLPKHQENDPFLKRIITRDEKALIFGGNNLKSEPTFIVNQRKMPKRN